MKFLILVCCACAALAAPQHGPAAAVARGAATPFVATADAAHTGVHSLAGGLNRHRRAVDSNADAQILRSDSEVRPDGFSYTVETSNGINSQATGNLQQPGTDHAFLAVQGSYKYPNPEDGSIAEITYTADENGYQPQGELIPTPHPVPEIIARSIEYIAAHPYTEPK